MNRRGQEGATFVEVLAALAIVTIIASALWFAAGSADGGLRRSMQRRRRSVQAMELQLTLIRQASRIRPPYWLGSRFDEFITAGSDQVRIGYLDGDSEAWLAISTGPDGVRLETSAGDHYRFPAIVAESVEVLRTDTDSVTPGTAFGVALGRGSDAERILGRFGGTTVSQVLPGGGRR